MSAPMLVSSQPEDLHPNEETLAAFVDDLLTPAERRETTEHLAACGDCREIVLTASDLKVTDPDLFAEPSPEPRRSTFRGKRGWAGAVAGLAAAATIAVVSVQPAWLFAPDMDDVSAASRMLDGRVVEGHLAGTFAHAEFRPPSQGEAPTQTPQVKLERIAAEARDPHVKAIALLLAGGDETEVIRLLNAAYVNAADENRDTVATDLAVALLARGRGDDASRALRLSDEVIARNPTPAAYWNRAVALERSNDLGQAVQGWADYLKVDASSEWAAEANRRKREFENLLSLAEP